jgi:hypothetical protein
VRKSGTREAYARISLLTRLRATASKAFVTFALHELDDGTEIRYESRHYRRGRGTGVPFELAHLQLGTLVHS